MYRNNSRTEWLEKRRWNKIYKKALYQSGVYDGAGGEFSAQGFNHDTQIQIDAGVGGYMFGKKKWQKEIPVCEVRGQRAYDNLVRTFANEDIYFHIIDII